ncbi:hypothetical protein VTJ04DRAFT_562 [Mycothermus thermophilus]|uniref:uncharacterized protein n=1 Tax=Humicola insolens TaxID=85995 RepID=UPI0037420013
MGSIYERTDAWPFFRVAGWFYTHIHTHYDRLRPLWQRLGIERRSRLFCASIISLRSSPRHGFSHFLFTLGERAAGRQANRQAVVYTQTRRPSPPLRPPTITTTIVFSDTHTHSLSLNTTKKQTNKPVHFKTSTDFAFGLRRAGLAGYTLTFSFLV